MVGPVIRFPTGWIKDRPHPKDRRASEVLGAAVPPGSYTNKHRARISAQKGNSCVGWAWKQILGVECEWDVEPSGLQTYWEGRWFSGMEDQDEGTYIRDAARGIIEHGWVSEQRWPISKPVLGKGARPGFLTMRFASRRWRGEYRRIYEAGDARIDAMKRAISAGRPVIFGTLVGQTFAGGNTLEPQADAYAGHAMVAHSYNGDVFEIANSWGTGWCNGGHCFMHARYFLWSRTDDLWVKV